MAALRRSAPSSARRGAAKEPRQSSASVSGVRGKGRAAAAASRFPISEARKAAAIADVDGGGRGREDPLRSFSFPAASQSNLLPSGLATSSKKSATSCLPDRGNSPSEPK